MKPGGSIGWRTSVLVAAAWLLLAAASAVRGEDGGGLSQVPDDPWPRTFAIDGAEAVVYQPQLDSWKDNRIEIRAAVGIRPAAGKEETFGVVWAVARTEVDRAARLVALEDITLTKSNFPTLADRGASYLMALQKNLSGNRTIALDRLETALAVSGAAPSVSLPVNNDPPRVFVSYGPAVLVSVQGAPVLQPVPGTQLERVINTRALILRPAASSTYYLHVYDGWRFAGTVQGPWYPPLVMPSGIDEVASRLGKEGVVDLMDGGGAEPKPTLAEGAPQILVSETPAELLAFAGQPAFAPIEGTQLSRATNTSSHVLLDSAKEYFVLLSGRWYRSGELAGPWSFVESTALPPDFSKIPPGSPAGAVLASVAGTPQAQEAVIANSIPQTATVPLENGPVFTPTYDGAPKFVPVEGTSYTYAVNAPTPVIQVAPTSYYALQGGVWFAAQAPAGPWLIATSVPVGIYAIPPSSPIHYVTYVRVYGSTPTAVYVGYTPGYLGTVVAPGGVVVYGTGYAYPAWTGSVWYPPPVTYGVMAVPVYAPAVGVTYAYAAAYPTTTVAVSYSNVSYHGGYYGTTSANVYAQYGSTTASGTKSWYQTPGGTYGTTTSGTYKNTATGNTGSFAGGRSYNPDTGQGQAGYTRTVQTPEGGSGQVSRGASYNTETGTAARSASATATAPGGQTATMSGSATRDASGQWQGQATRSSSNPDTGMSKTTTTSGADGQVTGRQTTVSNSNTGQSKTVNSGQAQEHPTTAPSSGGAQARSSGTGEAYAGKDGSVYRSNGSGGWEQHSAGGWQGASGDTSWADREQQARSQGQEQFNSFKQSGGSGGRGSWGGRSGGSGGWGGGGGGGRR